VAERPISPTCLETFRRSRELAFQLPAIASFEDVILILEKRYPMENQH
jgi:hypothetical protein